MRTTLALAALLAIACGAVPAVAQNYAGPARPGSYDWQGPYVGANLGYQMGWTANNPTKPSGIAGGVQGGYNRQVGQFVFGAETDMQFSAADGVFAPWKFSNPWFGTLRGRAGVALNNVLLYGTLGVAYGTLQAQSTATGATESKLHTGWAGGAGLEVALRGNWSAKAEYLYVDLTDRPYALTGTSNGLRSGLLRFGVNYRF
jgi:outer membrane immunogenic protein